MVLPGAIHGRGPEQENPDTMHPVVATHWGTPGARRVMAEVLVSLGQGRRCPTVDVGIPSENIVAIEL